MRIARLHTSDNPRLLIPGNCFSSRQLCTRMARGRARKMGISFPSPVPHHSSVVSGNRDFEDFPFRLMYFYKSR